LFKNEAAACTNVHQTSHFGIIGVVVVVVEVGVGGANWIAEALCVTSRSGQLFQKILATRPDKYEERRYQL